ncbi:MAG: nitrile hydratase accessory protein [Candidatus Binatia bacterium]
MSAVDDSSPSRASRDLPEGGDAVTRMAGAAALPRKNGELVFADPWQSRAFGIAVALHGKGAFPWSEFQRRLIDAVAATPAAAEGDPTEAYYRQWLEALERLVVEHGLVSPDELAGRKAALSTAPSPSRRSP